MSKKTFTQYELKKIKDTLDSPILSDEEKKGEEIWANHFRRPIDPKITKKSQIAVKQMVTKISNGSIVVSDEDDILNATSSELLNKKDNNHTPYMYSNDFDNTFWIFPSKVSEKILDESDLTVMNLNFCFIPPIVITRCESVAFIWNRNLWARFQYQKKN